MIYDFIKKDGFSKHNFEQIEPCRGELQCKRYHSLFTKTVQTNLHSDDASNSLGLEADNRTTSSRYREVVSLK